MSGDMHTHGVEALAITGARKDDRHCIGADGPRTRSEACVQMLLPSEKD